MAGNANPIYTRIGDVTTNGTTTMPTVMTTATADYTGASTNHRLIHTADATNGSVVKQIQFKAIGTNTASVARIYLNNGGVNTTAANNVFFDEISLPATTAINTASTVTITYSFPGNGVALPAGFCVYAGLGTTVAAGWVATCIAGKY